MVAREVLSAHCTHSFVGPTPGWPAVIMGAMSTRRAAVWAALVPVCLLWSADTLPPAARTPVDLAGHVEPLLRARCSLCHGAQQQMKGLRLDQKASTMRAS